MLIRGYHCIALFLGHITQRSDPVAFRRPKVNLHSKSTSLLSLYYTTSTKGTLQRMTGYDNFTIRIITEVGGADTEGADTGGAADTEV